MLKRPRILVDCDGILSDFVGPTLDLIHTHTGDRHHRDEIVRWDVFQSLGKKEHEHILDTAVQAGGFALNMPLLEGGKEAIERLRELGDVYIVTSPYDAPNWVYERNRWLEKHFGFNKKHVASISDKFIVEGSVLIDDSDTNLKAWSEHWPDGLPLLFDSPWNRHVEHPGVHRVHDWDTIVEKVKAFLAKP